MVARAKGGRNLVAGPAGANRYAVAEGLGHGDDVGLHIEMLEPEPASGPSETGLNLVDDEQQAPLVTDASHCLEVLRRRRVHAPLALHGLEDDRRALSAARRLLQGVGVVPRHVVEALRQGLERLVLLGLASGVEGGQRAAVEGAVRADDDMTAGARPAPRQLEGALVRLGARV